jgi:hypothetical protein
VSLQREHDDLVSGFGRRIGTGATAESEREGQLRQLWLWGELTYSRSSQGACCSSSSSIARHSLGLERYSRFENVLSPSEPCYCWWSGACGSTRRVGEESELVSLSSSFCTSSLELRVPRAEAKREVGRGEPRTRDSRGRDIEQSSRESRALVQVKAHDFGSFRRFWLVCEA